MENLVKKLEDKVQGRLVHQRVGLCSLLLLLALLVFINLGLTLWLLATLHLDMEGSGPVSYVPGGLRVEGLTQVEGELVTSRLTSRADQLRLVGAKQVVFSSQEAEFRLKHNTELRAPSFTISDSESSPLLSISSSGVTLGRGRLTAHSAALGEVLQAGKVKSRVGRPLTLESPTGLVELLGPSSTHLSSERGNVSLRARNGIKLQATEGQLLLDSSRVLLPSLPLATTTSSPTSSLRDSAVYQVCVCTSGRLFLSPATASCLARPSICTEI